MGQWIASSCSAYIFYPHADTEYSRLGGGEKNSATSQDVCANDVESHVSYCMISPLA
jgi:hypothetical protein